MRHQVLRGAGRGPGVLRRRQPGGQSLLREPGRLRRAREAGQELHAHPAIETVEQTHRARERGQQVRPQLVVRRHPRNHQVLPRTDQHPQPERVRTIHRQRSEPPPVGAQHVRQQERVEPVVLVARCAIPRTQRRDRPAGHHEHHQTRIQQRLHHRPVTTFDPDADHTMPVQDLHHPGQAGRGVVHREPFDHLTGLVDHADRVL